MVLELVLEVKVVQLAVGPDHQQAAGNVVITRASRDFLQEPHPRVAVPLPGVGAHQVVLATPHLVKSGNRKKM